MKELRFRETGFSMTDLQRLIYKECHVATYNVSPSTFYSSWPHTAVESTL